MTRRKPAARRPMTATVRKPLGFGTRTHRTRKGTLDRRRKHKGRRLGDD